MKPRLASSFLLLCLLGMTGGASAQAAWHDLPPDERQQMRQQMREHWQQNRETRREEGGRRWRDVPPEERRRLRQEIREQPGWQDNREERREGRERGGHRD